MKTITLEVDDLMAERFEKLSAKQKKSAVETLAMLIGDDRSLFEVMDNISEYAKKQGMTEDILKDILKNK